MIYNKKYYPFKTFKEEVKEILYLDDLNKLHEDIFFQKCYIRFKDGGFKTTKDFIKHAFPEKLKL